MSRIVPDHADDLPMSMLDVAETLGLRVALELIRHFGGLEVKWPINPRTDHPVIKTLGESDGRAVCEYLGGQPLYVPHARPARSVRSDVVRMEARGMDRAAIARALGVSMRHVRRMANRRGDDRQTSLDFD